MANPIQNPRLPLKFEDGQAKSKIQNQKRGQVLIEYTLAIFGVVMFLYVTLNVWFWFNQMLMERQKSFQDTRLDAGQRETAGLLVPYERPPIRLIGGPNSTEGDDPDGDEEPGEDFIPPEPPCDDPGNLFEQCQAAQETVAEKGEEIAILSAEIESLGTQIEEESLACEEEDEKDQGECFEENVQPLLDRLNEAIDELNTLQGELDEAMDNATAICQEAEEACDV
ncbi:MAG: hypothetical protein L0Y56_20045 [Nitrospira sp.]|nr:hypothetical protein [Nitrospira sp.]